MFALVATLPALQALCLVVYALAGSAFKNGSLSVAGDPLKVSGPGRTRAAVPPPAIPIHKLSDLTESVTPRTVSGNPLKGI